MTPPRVPAPVLRPVWLLDVDGVLNANRPGWGRAPERGVAHAAGREFVLHWSPALIARITGLHQEGLVDIRWATTWVDHIEQIQDLMRLPDFPVAFSGLPADTPHVPVPGLKAEAALAVTEQEGRPLIWADDDAIPEVGPVARRLASSGQDVLLISPDPRKGLQPGHLDAVEDFLRSLPST